MNNQDKFNSLQEELQHKEQPISDEESLKSKKKRFWSKVFGIIFFITLVAFVVFAFCNFIPHSLLLSICFCVISILSLIICCELDNPFGIGFIDGEDGDADNE